MAQIMKESKTWRVDTENEAVSMIEDYKEQSANEPWMVSKSGYTIKTKKSKGEIVDMWAVVTIELTYEW